MQRQDLKFNPFADQLRFSTMARAATVGALDSHLLVNRRAHGNLHRLPSAMFYEGQMRSAYNTAESMNPPSTVHLRQHLERLGGRDSPLPENRIIVQLQASAEETFRSSFWNPVHHEWVLKEAERLLGDRKFESVIRPGTPGTVIIATPYSTAMRQYHGYVKQMPDEWQERIEVLTVDRAQGNQADVVILDMVRSTRAGFMDDPKRLNVALTRARQAEIIVMHHMMTMQHFRGQMERTQYTSQLWDDTMADGRLFNL